MKRALLMVSLSAACSSTEFAQLVVEVDADLGVLPHLRTVEVAVYDGDQKIDATSITPTEEPPSCIPFSVGVVPTDGDPNRAVSVVVRAELKTGGDIVRRVDTHFAPGTRLLSIMLEASCVESDCDRTETIEPPPAVDEKELELRIARTECKQLLTPTQCLNAGGCFDELDLVAPVCLLPCPAHPDTPPLPDPPAPPRATSPVMLPCPMGWLERDQIACEPWMGAKPVCGAGELIAPGDASCAPLSACPAGEWPENLPAAAIYVRAGAMGGDGSEMSPFGSLADALNATGAVIALGKGDHRAGAVIIARSVEVIGACAEETTLQATSIVISAPNVRLEGLASSAIEVTGGAVSIQHASVSALTVAGQTELIDASVGAGGIELEGTLTATRADVAGAVNASGARIELTKSAVGSLHASGGAVAIARELAIEDDVSATGAGTIVRVDRAVVRSGASASESAFLGLARALCEGAEVTAATGAHLDLQDLFLTGRSLRATGARVTALRLRVDRATDGIVFSEGAAATITGLEMTGARDASVTLEGVSTRLVLEDAIITDTRSGPGIDAASGTHLTVRRARITGSEGNGVHLSSNTSTRSTVLLEDLEVRGTTPTNDETDDGFGIRAGSGSRDHRRMDVTIRRALLEENHSAGLMIFASDAKLFDISSNRTRVGPRTKSLGLGISVSEAEVHGQHIACDENVDAGILAGGSAARVELEDVTVTRTTCAMDVQFCGVFRGTGVGQDLGAYIALDRFLLDHNYQNGLQLNFEGIGGLSNGVISNSATGIYVRTGAFDVQRVGVNVVFENNGHNVLFGDEPM